MNDIQPLIELQDIDERIREMEKEMTDIPARKEMELSRLNGAQMSLAQAKAELVDIQLKIKQCDTEIAEKEAKIQQLLISQATASGQKEYVQIDISVAQLKSDVAAAGERKAAAQDEIPHCEKAVAEAQARLDEERKGIDDYVKELDERLSEVKEASVAAQAERAEALKNVSPRSKLYYDRLSKKRWPVVVSLSEDGACNGCHMVQPPSVAQMVAAQMKNGTADRPPVVCTMCGRILYRDF